MIGSHIMELPEETLYHLKQFTKNINNYTVNQKAQEYFSFYQKNFKSLNQAWLLKKELNRHVWEEVNSVPDKLSGLNLSIDKRKSRTYSYYYDSEAQDAFFTVIPKIIGHENPSIRIIVELWKGALEKLDEIDKLKFTDEARKLILTKDQTQIQNEYLHYAAYELKVAEKDIEGLGQYIADSIRDSTLLSIYTEIQEFLKP